MRFGDTPFRPVAACGLTAAALLACCPASRAQTTPGGTGGGPVLSGSPAAMSSVGAGPVMIGNVSPTGGGFGGGNSVGFPGNGGYGGSPGTAFGGTGSLGGGGSVGGVSGGTASTGTGGGAMMALTVAAVNRNSPLTGVAPAPPLPSRLPAELRDLISRSDDISPATRNSLTSGFDAGGTLVVRGTVAGPAEAHALETILRFAPGVAAVRDEMTIRAR
jgi:hypothetical protein